MTERESEPHAGRGKPGGPPRMTRKDAKQVVMRKFSGILDRMSAGELSELAFAVRQRKASVGATGSAAAGAPRPKEIGRMLGARFDEPRGVMQLSGRREAGLAEEVADAYLAEALDRGKASAAEILAGPDMLSAAQVAARLGISRQAVHGKQRRGELLGLKGARRGLRYPAWQISEEGLPYEGIDRLHRLFQGNAWRLFRFLTMRHPELGGKTGAEGLRGGKMDALEAAAENYLRGAS